MNQPPVVCFQTPRYFQPPMFFAPQPLTYPQPLFMYQTMMFAPHPPTYPHPLFMNWNQPPSFCGFNFFWQKSTERVIRMVWAKEERYR